MSNEKEISSSKFKTRISLLPIAIYRHKYKKAKILVFYVSITAVAVFQLLEIKLKTCRNKIRH